MLAPLVGGLKPEAPGWVRGQEGQGRGLGAVFEERGWGSSGCEASVPPCWPGLGYQEGSLPPPGCPCAYCQEARLEFLGGRVSLRWDSYTLPSREFLSLSLKHLVLSW